MNGTALSQFMLVENIAPFLSNNETAIFASVRRRLDSAEERHCHKRYLPSQRQLHTLFILADKAAILPFASSIWTIDPCQESTSH
jgi:hypothetical protein